MTRFYEGAAAAPPHKKTMTYHHVEYLGILDARGLRVAASMMATDAGWRVLVVGHCGRLCPNPSKFVKIDARNAGDTRRHATTRTLESSGGTHPTTTLRVTTRVVHKASELQARVSAAVVLSEKLSLLAPRPVYPGTMLDSRCWSLPPILRSVCLAAPSHRPSRALLSRLSRISQVRNRVMFLELPTCVRSSVTLPIRLLTTSVLRHQTRQHESHLCD